MQPNTLEMAKLLLYFSDSVDQEIKANTYSLFCEVWEKIPKEDQSMIVEYLEFILIKPVIDPIFYDTAALARISPTELSSTSPSPTQPVSMSWIMWYPLFPFSMKKKKNILILAHELAHVYLRHPQQGAFMTKEELQESKSEAENQVEEQLLKWNILPDSEDEN